MTILGRAFLTAAAVVAMSAVPLAHITIAPNQSMEGATEKYTLRVPTESKVATVAAELDVPDGIVVETVAVPYGWKYEVKRDANNRIVGIVWMMNIPPGEFAEFSFVARNPRATTEIVWGLRQRFADGTVQDFTKAPNGGVRATAVTKLTPRPVQ